MLEAQIQLNGEDCKLLFPTPRERLWRERTFYRDVWRPTREASGLDIRPYECRHSYVTHLRAAGVNDADLAEIAGHRVETMLARYTHAVGQSFGIVRKSIEEGHPDPIPNYGKEPRNLQVSERVALRSLSVRSRT
jgi:site-specific recombinase XerD